MTVRLGHFCDCVRSTKRTVYLYSFIDRLKYTNLVGFHKSSGASAMIVPCYWRRRSFREFFETIVVNIFTCTGNTKANKINRSAHIMLFVTQLSFVLHRFRWETSGFAFIYSFHLRTKLRIVTKRYRYPRNILQTLRKLLWLHSKFDAIFVVGGKLNYSLDQVGIQSSGYSPLLVSIQ